jgi:hypothetical protein
MRFGGFANFSSFPPFGISQQHVPANKQEQPRQAGRQADNQQAAAYQLPKLGDVMGCHRLRVRQLGREAHWDAYLVRRDVLCHPSL